MKEHLTNISVVAGATAFSRVLGLVRDVLMLVLLGTAAGSVFVVAFTLPNLLRRLLGEGALTSAFVPVMAQELEGAGAASGFALLNRVATRLAAVLAAALVFGGAALVALVAWEGLEERWYRGADYGLLMLPYLVPVCLAALLAAALNVTGRFAAAALSPVWLNLAMIAAMVAAALIYPGDAAAGLTFLSAGVLAGGAIQLLVPAVVLGRAGWRPGIDLSPSPGLAEVWRLLLPGLAGAAIFQLNTAVARLIAFAYDEAATALIYVANRLIELPLGIFAIAVTTVVFPDLSRLAAKGDDAAFAGAFRRGWRQILAITVPASVGLVALGRPVLDLLFRWGLFGAEDLDRAVPVLAVFALGIPFYALATYVTRGFHARKDMRTPVRLGAFTFVLHIGLCLLWVTPFGVAGLAAASVASMAFHGLVLVFRLRGCCADLGRGARWRPLLQVLAAAGGMAVVVGGGRALVDSVLPGKWASLVAVGLLVPAGAAVHVALLSRLGFEEAGALRGWITRWIPLGRKGGRA